MSKSQKRLDSREFQNHYDNRRWNIERKKDAEHRSEKRLASALKTKNVNSIIEMYDDEYEDEEFD